MATWFWYAVVAAVLYGAHQIFTRLAADRIGEGLGGFGALGLSDDEILEREFIVYDALYSECKRRVSRG